MLNFDVHNNQNQTRSGVVVFEVRDSNEFTVYLGWQSVNVGANGNSSMAVSWVPSDDGRYVIRTFALQGLEGDEVKSWSAIYESRRLNVE